MVTVTVKPPDQLWDLPRYMGFCFSHQSLGGFGGMIVLSAAKW